MAALGLSQTSSLDYSSALPSCSGFRPSAAPAAARLGISKRGRIVCSSSGGQPQQERKSALTKLVATGLAIVISSSSGVAFSDAAVTDIGIAQKQAENLLRDADKLTNDESPPRVGPSRGGVKDEDAGRIALKGGAGAIPDLQNPGSELVDEARGKLADTTETTKQRFNEQLGKVQDKAGETRENVKGFFGQAGNKAGSKADEAKENVGGFIGQAGDKAKSGIQDATKGPGSKAEEAKDNVKGFFGQAGDKIKDSVDSINPGNTKENVKGFFGQAGDKIKDGVNNPGDKAKELVGSAKNNTSNMKEDAGSKAKDLVGSAKSNIDNVTRDSKGLVGDAQSKVKSNVDKASKTKDGLFGSLKKGFGMQ